MSNRFQWSKYIINIKSVDYQMYTGKKMFNLLCLGVLCILLNWNLKCITGCKVICILIITFKVLTMCYWSQCLQQLLYTVIWQSDCLWHLTSVLLQPTASSQTGVGTSEQQSVFAFTVFISFTSPVYFLYQLCLLYWLRCIYLIYQMCLFHLPAIFVSLIRCDYFICHYCLFHLPVVIISFASHVFFFIYQ